jgi:hypothetical protein
LLASQALRIEKKAKAEGLAGFDVISLLSMLLPFLCKAINPEPVNPTPNPTPTQADAWTKAWRAKSAAVDNVEGDSYRQATINKAAAKIRQQHRKDGTPIKKHEAQRLAVIVLDDARVASMPELYSNILEAEHHS